MKFRKAIEQDIVHIVRMLADDELGENGRFKGQKKERLMYCN